MTLLVDALLQDDALNYANCRQIALTILQHKKSKTELANNRAFCQQLYKYTNQIASEEIDTLVKDKTLKLPVLKVNSETLDKFNVKIITEHQKQVIPFTTSLVKATAGLDNVDNSAFDSNNKPAMELGEQ